MDWDAPGGTELTYDTGDGFYLGDNSFVGDNNESYLY